MSDQPIAWGMPRPDSTIIDCITPEEHARCKGQYTIPLYAAPRPKAEPPQPDPMELVRDLEKFATNPSERLLAKELGSLLFDHSTLKTENAKLKRDLHDYMLAANAEAELVDDLQKENEGLKDLLGKANALCRIRHTRIKENEALLRQALEALETCDAAHPSDGGRQWYDEKAVEATITAIRARLEDPK